MRATLLVNAHKEPRPLLFFLLCVSICPHAVEVARSAPIPPHLLPSSPLPLFHPITLPSPPRNSSRKAVRATVQLRPLGLARTVCLETRGCFLSYFPRCLCDLLLWQVMPIELSSSVSVSLSRPTFQHHKSASFGNTGTVKTAVSELRLGRFKMLFTV